MATISPKARSAVMSVLIGLGFVTAASAAQADIIQINSYSDAYGFGDATLHYASSLLGNGQHDAEVSSGAILLAATDITTGAAHNTVAFCIDILHDLTAPATYVTGTLSATIADPVKQAQIAALVSNGVAILASGGDGVHSLTQISSSFQLAIWTAEFQTGTSGYAATDSSRNFYISGDPSDAALINTYLTNVTNGTFKIAMPVEALNSQTGRGQNLADATPSKVPEPASFMVVAVGLTGLLAMRKSRRRF